MNIVLKLIAYMLVFVLLIKVNTEDRMIMLGEVRTYSAGILATHDAAIIRHDYLADGYIVFDEAQGTLEFRKSLIDNLALNDDFSPKNNAIFSGPIRIAGLFFIGDNKVPADEHGQPTYPYEFEEQIPYRGDVITVREIIHGPSVVAYIEAPLQVEGNPVKLKNAVYRYLDKNL